MKSIFTFLLLSAISTFPYSQIIFQSDFSSWTSGAPDSWMGTKTNIPGANVVEINSGSLYGSSNVQLINTSTSHQRFTTTPLSVTDEQAYEIKFWVKGEGEIRTGLFDDHLPSGSSGFLYNDYIHVNSSVLTEFTQIIVAFNTNVNAEFILSVRNTLGPTHLEIDSVVITEIVLPPPATVSIYDIQYTTDVSGDSPEEGNIVTTSGIVTGIFTTGDVGKFFIQDGSGPWSGIYVYESGYPVSIGDSIEVTGMVTEYYGLTEITDVSNLQIISSGHAAPMPVTIPVSDVSNEEYESVLVSISQVTCTNQDAGFGQFIVSDTANSSLIDDQIFSYTANLNYIYDITGIRYFYLGETKICPRNAEDIVLLGALDQENFSFEFDIYPNPAQDKIYITSNGEINLQLYTAAGTLIYQQTGGTPIDVSEMTPGFYLLNIRSAEREFTQKIIIE